MTDQGMDYLTTGAVARHFRVPVWKVRRLFERHLLPPASRIGLQRVIPLASLPAIESALRRAGYLPGPRHCPTDLPHPGTGTAKEITDGQPA
jgi:hypothetical protein